VVSDSAGALGKIGTSEAVQALISALRDESADVRSFAGGALGEVSKGRTTRGTQEVTNQIATELRVALNESRNEMVVYVSIGGKNYPHVYDCLWEALWIICQMMESAKSASR